MLPGRLERIAVLSEFGQKTRHRLPGFGLKIDPPHHGLMIFPAPDRCQEGRGLFPAGRPLWGMLVFVRRTRRAREDSNLRPLDPESPGLLPAFLLVGLKNLMAFINIKSAELLNLVPNPADFHIDFSCVLTKPHMDNLIVTG